MKVTKDKTENSQAFLTIEMEPIEVEESLEKSYYRLAKKANVPGFRKGKVPRDVLERYIGKESLLEDALKYLVPQAYEKAIKEAEIEPFAQPSIEIAQTDPLVFKATVPLPPTVTLGDYHNIRLTPEPVEVAEGDISAAIEQLRHQQAIWEPVERQVNSNDLVVLDVEGNIEGEPFVNQKGVQYQVIRDQSVPAPGFAEQLIGMKRDEDKEFKLQYPSDYSRSELAGKEPSFKVRVIEIKQERLPELNDEFAKEIAPDIETMDSLRERVSTQLRLRAEEKAKTDFEERVIEAVADVSQVEFPPILAKAEIAQFINRQAQSLQMGEGGLEEYLKRINKTGEELQEELRPQATKRVTQSLVLGKVAEEEKIEVSDSDINAEIENLTSSATEDKDKLRQFLDNPQSRDSMKRLLMTRKTVQRLVDIAKGLNVNTEKVQEEDKHE